MAVITTESAPRPEGRAAASPTSKRIRFDQIDALRGLAALMVVLQHSFVYVTSPSWPRITLLGYSVHPTHVFYYNYIGVNLFLVLSGFCLSWPFLASREREFSVRVYARKRFWRIYPAYFITFMTLLLAGWLYRTLAPAGFALPFFSQPLTLAQILASLTLQMTHLNPVFWTLCLELRWYLIFPLVLLFARRYSAWPLLPLAVLASVLTPRIEGGLLSPLKLLIYLPAFVAGVIAAEVQARPDTGVHPRIRKAALPGTILFLALCAWILPLAAPRHTHTWWDVLPTTGLFFFLVLLALQNERPLSRPAEALRRVGIFSYSLYLIHVPLLEISYRLIDARAWHPAAQLLFYQVGLVLIIVGASYLFYLAAERPFLGKESLPASAPLVPVHGLSYGRDGNA